MCTWQGRGILYVQVCQSRKDLSGLYLSAFSPVSAVLYGVSSPPETLDVPDCGPNTQTYPTLLPASLDWALEEKELPDPFAFQVSQVHLELCESGAVMNCQ